MMLSSVGMFPGSENVVFLAPVVTRSLLEAHAELHASLHNACLPCDPLYRPGVWVPHCAITVGGPLSQTVETIEQIHHANVLGEYTIDNVNVVRFRPVVTLSSFQLGSGEAEPSVPGDA